MAPKPGSLTIRRADLAAVVVGIAMVLALPTSHGRGAAWTSFATIVLASLVSVVPHELGHAFAAWVMGSRIDEIRFGVPGVRSVRKVSLAGLPLAVGPRMSGGSARTRFSPPLLPGRAAITLLAGPIAGAAVLFAAAALVSRADVRTALIVAAVITLVGNLVPNRPGTSNSDGTRLLELCTRRGRNWARLARLAHVDLKGPLADSDMGRQDELLAAVDQLLQREGLDEVARRHFRGIRATCLWRAGRFLDSAAEHATVDGHAAGWADAVVAAALFGDPDVEPALLGSVTIPIEARAASECSLAADHTLAVLRLVQRRPIEAWRGLGRRDDPAVTAPERAALLATQALCAPDPETREELVKSLTELAPWSPWTRLVLDTQGRVAS